MSIKEINNEPARHNKQMLTKNRIINSIDKAAALENYDLIELPDHEKRNFRCNKRWKEHTNYNIRIGRKGTQNVISSKPRVTKAARNAKTELEHLKYFITNEMLESVLHNTDTKTIKTISKLPENCTNKHWLYEFQWMN